MNVIRYNNCPKSPLERVLRLACIAALAGLFVPFGSAEAGVFPIDNTSRVDATVTDTSGTGQGPYLYEFEVFNTSEFLPSEAASHAATSGIANGGVSGTPLIVDWELPLFSLADIDQNSLTSPDNWFVQIVTDPDELVPPNNEDVWTYDAASDPLAQAGDYGPNPEVFENPPLVLHWYTQPNNGGSDPIFPGDSLGGFSFLSDFTDVAAPYQSSWEFFPQNTGDPPIPDNAFGSPNSPARQQAQGIPEPSAAVLLGIGFIALLVGAGWARAPRPAPCIADSPGAR